MAADALTSGGARRGRLAQRRKALGLTQEALADLLGVERSTVVRWERGDTEPQPWTRPMLAKALRVSADCLGELLDMTGPPSPRADRNEPSAAVPRQLPAALPHFTGRAAELQALTQILDQAGTEGPGTVVISAIGGTAGVGKTAFALHWAHQVAARFPDGQLYVNLRGFDAIADRPHRQCPGRRLLGKLARAHLIAEHVPGRYAFHDLLRAYAAVTLADGTGLDAHAWQLPWAMTLFLDNRGHFREWAATQRTALAAATRAGDAAGQAVSGRLLAAACAELGDYDQAASHLASSLRLYRQLGNRHGEATTHINLAVLAQRQGRYADALGHEEQALRLSRAAGDVVGEAAALSGLGWCHGLLGDYQQARAFCRQALALCAETGHRRLEGNAWDSLGCAEHQLGNLGEAATCYQRALSIARELGNRPDEAEALTHLGDTRNAAGDLPQAQGGLAAGAGHPRGHPASHRPQGPRQARGLSRQGGLSAPVTAIYDFADG